MSLPPEVLPPSLWHAQLEHLLLEGRRPADLLALRELLQTAPSGWVSRCGVGSRRSLPCWASVFFNPYADSAKFQNDALALLGQFGAAPFRAPKRPLFGAAPIRRRPLADRLLDHCHTLNAPTLALLLERQDWLTPTNPEQALAWMNRLFQVESDWGRGESMWDVVSCTLRKAPVLMGGEWASRLWALGLGFVGDRTVATRSLVSAVICGLDATAVIETRHLPVSPDGAWAFGNWVRAPAWAWAADRRLLHGNSLLIHEACATRPHPWNPNAFMDDGSCTIGAWLLRRSLSEGDAGDRVRELEALGMDWLIGPDGQRPIDVIAAHPDGPEAVGEERWDAITAMDAAGRLETALAVSTPPRQGRRF